MSVRNISWSKGCIFSTLWRILVDVFGQCRHGVYESSPSDKVKFPQSLKCQLPVTLVPDELSHILLIKDMSRAVIGMCSLPDHRDLLTSFLRLTEFIFCFGIHQ